MNLGKRVRPRLVFDSFSAVTSAGVRTRNRSDRHCVYGAGHVLVDLVLEYVRESNEVVVIGQITNAKMASQVLPAQDVFMVSRNMILDRTQSNNFGEFYLRSKVVPKPRLVLRLEDGNRWMDISLSNLSTN